MHKRLIIFYFAFFRSFYFLSRNSNLFRRFAHDHQQVVGHGIAVGRAAGQLSEKQDVFRVEIAVRQVADHLRRFVGVVEQFVGAPGLRLWCRNGVGADPTGDQDR